MNKPKIKRQNVRIVELCDELLREPETTAPKVKRTLVRHGFHISLSIIYRIGVPLLWLTMRLDGSLSSFLKPLRRRNVQE